MLSFLTTPWSLLGLLAVPALVGIYLLRNRFRKLPVSSLMFWLEQRELRAGGLRVRRLQTPLLFFLELAAIVFLVGAAAGPHNTHAVSARPLVVVLDDSYSMLAGGDESARRLAKAALREELGEGVFSVRLVLAGEAPQVLGELSRTAMEAEAALDGWRCQAPAARLEAAMALARQLGGERGIVLVLSDHAPPFELEKGRVRWWAFGKPRPNLAFVNAARSSRAGRDRCLVEIANLAGQAYTGKLVLRDDKGTEVHSEPLALAARESRTLAMQLKDAAPVLHAHLDTDALPIDNHAILVQESQAKVRIDVQIAQEDLRRLVSRALDAAGNVVQSATLPDLLITDHPEPAAPRAETWIVRFQSGKDAEAYVGPFVLDRTHPLTEGLTLQGIVWGAGKSTSTATPVILAGNVPLLTDTESLGRHQVTIHFRPEFSTLQDSPQWPILIANLVHWRGSQAPGLQRRNYRLGETAVVRLAPGVETVSVTAPDGTTRPVPVQGMQGMIRMEQVGLYEVLAGDKQYPAGVSTLNQEESDLSKCVTGTWGEWADDQGQLLEIREFGWVLVLLAVAVLSLHLFLMTRGGHT